MAKLKKGELEIETSIPREIVNLKAQGFREVKHDLGGPLAGGLSGVVNDTGKPEAIVVAPKPGTPRK